MIKDTLALVGLVVLARKGYEFYCHYRSLKQENQFLRQQQQGQKQQGPGEQGQAAATMPQAA